MTRRRFRMWRVDTRCTSTRSSDSETGHGAFFCYFSYLGCYPFSVCLLSLVVVIFSFRVHVPHLFDARRYSQSGCITTSMTTDFTVTDFVCAKSESTLEGRRPSSTSVLEIHTRRHGASSSSFPLASKLSAFITVLLQINTSRRDGPSSNLHLRVPHFNSRRNRPTSTSFLLDFDAKRQDLSHPCSLRFRRHEDKISSTSAHPNFETDPSTLIHHD